MPGSSVVQITRMVLRAIPMTYQPSKFLRAAVAALTCGLSLFLIPAAAAAGATKSFDIPAGEALPALKKFVAQSGEQLLYSAEAVQGVTTNPVKGVLTAREALDQMVGGTDLRVVADKKNGALSLVRAPNPNAVRAAQTAKASDRPENRGASDEAPVVLDDYQVTGSRMRLNSGEQPAQPVLTFTALDIERTGASNLAQLFQYIPGITGSTSGGYGLEVVSSSTGATMLQSASRTSAQLRGGAESATLLLVDGKRVARTGQRNGGGVGFDLGGIPLSAVDRVEVLLDGASAIYGNDALYGVINVILKKRYSGTEVRLTYDNTFDNDAGIRTASLTHGFAKGKWSGLITLSANENNIQMMEDRAYTASYNRVPYGGTFNGLLLSAPIGSLSVASGNLPGLTTGTVSIPPGSNGQNLTVADFVNAPAPDYSADLIGPRPAMNYAVSKSAYARLGYEFGEHLELSGMVRLGRTNTRNIGSYLRIANFTLPVGYPGNPFSVPVRLSQTYFDQPLVTSGYKVSNNEFGVSAKGKLLRDWRYEASLNYVRGINYGDPDTFNGQVLGLFNANLLNAAIAAGRRPILVYDTRTQSPNPPGALNEFFLPVPGNYSILSDVSQTWTYAAQADGPLFSLPAGEVRAVVGAEFREEYIDTPKLVTSPSIIWNPYPLRRVESAFAEVRVPIVAPRHGWPLVHQLDANLAVRSEGYSDVKGGQSLTPRYGVAWRPIRSLLVRGSYGEGFLVPNLYNTLPRQTQSTLTFAASANAIDTLRGNQNLTGQTYVLYSGGNPDLRPQRSENWTYGVVWEVPKLKGLSVSFDYYDNHYIDRFGIVGTFADRLLYAPETFVRGPNLPGDPAGWPGPITGYDGRTINIATARNAGYNFGVRWQRTTPWGELGFSTTGERMLVSIQQVVPGAVPTPSVNKKFIPMRIVSSLFWSRGSWDAGVTANYQGRYWRDTNNAALSVSRWTDDVIRWDANASYDFGKNRSFGDRGSAWWRRALHDTKWSVSIINALDTEPPMDALGGFLGNVIDPRLRRYVIDLTKRF